MSVYYVTEWTSVCLTDTDRTYTLTGRSAEQIKQLWKAGLLALAVLPAEGKGLKARRYMLQRKDWERFLATHAVKPEELKQIAS